jgi:hypothetical protein
MLFKPDTGASSTAPPMSEARSLTATTDAAELVASIVYLSGPGGSTLYSAFGLDGNWQQGRNGLLRLTPGGLSAAGGTPAMCTYKDLLYVVYQGRTAAGPNPGLCMAVYDGSKWQGGQYISQLPGKIMPQTDVYPALAVFNELLYVIYKKAGANDIYYAWFDGSTWFGDEVIEPSQGQAPQTDQGLDAVWCGSGPGQDGPSALRLVHRRPGNPALWTTNFDGANWVEDLPIPTYANFQPRSNQNPALATLPNGALGLFYPDVSTNQLRMARFDSTNGWTGDTVIRVPPNNTSLTSEYSPAVTALNDRLCLIYKQLATQDLYEAYFDGSTWSGGTKIVAPTSTPTIQTSWRPATATIPLTPASTDWLRSLPDSASVVAITLPGTHDSAAISSWPFHTPYACHSNSITDQLNAGIRLLDVRLQVALEGGQLVFNTCHGSIGSELGLNVYQSFPSLLDECKQFLRGHQQEFIAMSLKIDDNCYPSVNPPLVQHLTALLAQYPVKWATGAAPTLGDVRGHVYVFNRDIDPSLGFSLAWPDNTTGTMLQPDSRRNFPVYVQDEWKFGVLSTFPDDKKMAAFTQAMTQVHGGSDLLINFASATTWGGGGLYIHRVFLAWLGQYHIDARPRYLGWALWDYETLSVRTDTYGYLNPVQVLIDSNFGYRQYSQPFAPTFFG